MKHTIELMLAAAVMAAGCGKLATTGNHGTDIRPNVKSSILSKGTTTTEDNLKAFKMIAVTGEYIDYDANETIQPVDGIYFSSFARNDGSGWDIYDTAEAASPSAKYWISGNPIAFWCWAPFDTGAEGTLSVTTPAAPPATGSGSIVFDYTLPDHVDGADATKQQDLVFAGNIESRTFNTGTEEISSHTSTNTDYNRNDNQLDIVFHHALSKVQFGVNVSDESFDKDLKIKTIQIAGVKGTGRCTFTAPKTFAWVPGTEAVTCSQDYNADFSLCTGSSGAPEGWPYNTSNGLNVCTESFFLIPQSAGGLELGITFEKGGVTQSKTAVLPAKDWESGHYYIYKIKAHGSAENLTMSVSLYDWEEREDVVPII